MNILHKHIIPLILFVAVSTSSTVSAQVEEYLPLTRTELSKRFPLRYHGTIEEKERIIRITGKQSLSTIQISMTEDVILTGQDERHMPWRFHIQGYGNLYLYNMYTADLDLNDYEDIILLVSTGGSGLAPTTHLITLLFDTSGCPIPFEADGYWKHDEQSIAGLVDLDNNGKEDILFTIETQHGETIVCSPVSWYASFAVVIDTERREIASLSAREHTVKTLLDEIIAQQYEVAVYGQRRADQCSPELLWAQPLSSVQKK